MVFSSCKKDWLDEKSDLNQTIPATLQDFEYLLDDFVTMNNTTPGLGELGSDGHYVTEARWAALIMSINSEKAQANAYTWSHNLPYLTIADWNNSYQKIFYCNLVLDGLKKVSIDDQVRFNHVKGNALFHRAKNYFDLAQIYAQPYQSVSAVSDIGIPLKEGIDVTELARRASVKETYDQIISDLSSAVNLLPQLPSLPTRGSKTAAFALLARSYLVMGDHINAGIYSDSSLNIYSTLMDYNTIPSSNTNLGRFNAETIFFSTSNNSYTFNYSAGFLFIDTALYNLYNNNDLRKTRFFTVGANGIAFKGTYNSSIIPFSGIATDELYLIRAECYARAGNITAAMKDLNDLVRKRWDNTVPYPTITASSAEEAVKKILIERKKELLLRGIRWSDLRRLNQEDAHKQVLTRNIGGTVYTLEPGSYKYTLPIPDDVLSLGPGIQQTPGW